MGIRVPVRLKSVEDLVVKHHGSFRQLSLSERKVLRLYADHINDLIQASWPVDTGYSRDGFITTIRASARPFQILIENDVWYVQYIRQEVKFPVIKHKFSCMSSL